MSLEDQENQEDPYSLVHQLVPFAPEDPSPPLFQVILVFLGGLVFLVQSSLH